MIRFCFFFFSGSGVLGVWYEAGADCFCFAGEGVMAFPAVLFDGEDAAFGVGVKVPVGGCRTDVEECGNVRRVYGGICRIFCGRGGGESSVR